MHRDDIAAIAFTLFWAILIGAAYLYAGTDFQ